MREGEQVRRRVGREVRVGGARVRRAPAAVELVEQHNAVGAGVKQPPVPPRAPRARAAVRDDRRLAARVPARLLVYRTI